MDCKWLEARGTLQGPNDCAGEYWVHGALKHGVPVSQCTSVVWHVDSRGRCACWGPGGLWKTLYFLLGFALNLKLLKRVKLINWKKKKSSYFCRNIQGSEVPCIQLCDAIDSRPQFTLRFTTRVPFLHTQGEYLPSKGAWGCRWGVEKTHTASSPWV